MSYKTDVHKKQNEKEKDIVTTKPQLGGGGISDTFVQFWITGFILRLTAKVIPDKSLVL